MGGDCTTGIPFGPTAFGLAMTCFIHFALGFAAQTSSVDGRVSDPPLQGKLLKMAEFTEFGLWIYRKCSLREVGICDKINC